MAIGLGGQTDNEFSMNSNEVKLDGRLVRKLIDKLEHSAISYAQHPDKHASRRLSDARAKLLAELKI